MLKINPYLDDIEISVIRKIAEAASEYKNIKEGKKLINLTIGEPDLPQSMIIKEETANYIMDAKLGYSQLGGVLELREEIAKYYKNKYNVDVKPDEIIITVGSTEGLSTAIKTVILPGDEVITPLPVYPGYEPLIILAGAKLIKVDTSKDNYELTVETLKRYVNEKTKAIILNYPSNPSGVVISEKNRDEILKFVKENNIYIISDEVYSEILFEGKHNTFLQNNFRDNVILVNGFSKSHSLTGWRIGYVISSKKIRDYLIKVHQYTVTSASIISQKGALIALKKCSCIDEQVKIYKERAIRVYDRLQNAGINAIKPKGAIYIFVSIGEGNSLKFAEKLLESQRVAVVPGIAFGMDNFIRLSLVSHLDELLEATDRIIEFINSNRV
ncbi:aminotransferase class I/II-fold pyridoxal phosphate-dependent enzyme [Cetobacterium sp. 8H]|uniref:pyridoxal phosphate-dependent aminotransferase n=1 Tax=Cetobacterium sp. 8H TaxID=2759681 RepID=UPI00163BBBD4|nr:aminotransferase class I/II-fold pyridoxal phosphate-dependent enzyme [Cetobacterium sp. 8H]MBC2850457.1 aminotransferase class I/II-fold pyridoxal phosphate-dependent enzyme [Cetobacterium sp. 8H]